jgi:hypothetical protein
VDGLADVIASAVAAKQLPENEGVASPAARNDMPGFAAGQSIIPAAHLPHGRSRAADLSGIEQRVVVRFRRDVKGLLQAALELKLQYDAIHVPLKFLRSTITIESWTMAVQGNPALAYNYR